jgi:hypothetical protein
LAIRSADHHICYTSSSLFKKQPAPGRPANHRVDTVSKERPVSATVQAVDAKPNRGGTRTATGIANTDQAICSRSPVNELRANNMTARTSCSSSTAAAGRFQQTKLREKQLHPLLVRLGIPRGGFHSMRHGAASSLLADGATPAVVQRQLRHSDARITLGI